MQLARVLLAAILFCQWIVSPAWAQSAAKAQVVMKVSEKYIGKIGRSIGIRGLENEVGAEIKDASGKVVGYLALPKSAKTVDMTKFSPRALGEMNRTKSFLSSNFMKRSAEVVMNFPMEAFSFFLAIGIQNARQLVFQYQDNPVVMQQFLESQKDPVGQVGFLAFMMANSHLTSPLMAMTAPGSPLQSFIPYLGMTAGMLASNMVSEIAQFPQMNACIAEINKRASEPKKYENCQKAYSSWIQAIGDKGFDMIPGLVSMMASTVLSGLIEEYILNRVIVAVGAEIILAASTDGMSLVARGGRFAYHIAKTVMFLDLDHVIKPFVENPYNNIKQGTQLSHIETDIVKSLYDKKSRGWNRTAPQNQADLDAKLQGLIEAARTWRRFNLSEISQMHSTWHQYMNNFISTYKGAQDFYTSFGEERKKIVKANVNNPSFLHAQLPLAGVTPKAPEGEFKDVQLEPLANPDAVKYQQVQTLIDIREKYSNLFDPYELYKVTPYKNEAENIRKFLSGLPTKEDFTLDKINYEAIAKALQWLNYATDPDDPYPGLIPPTPRKTESNDTYKVFLNRIRAEIGNPMPMRTPGMGYLHSYEEDTKVAAIHKSIQVPWMVKRIHSVRPSDYFAAQMLIGPDVSNSKESLINFNRWLGYPVQFMPPRITVPLKLEFNDPYYDTNVLLGLRTLPTVFNVPTTAKIQGRTVEYKTIFDVLRDTSNHQDSIFSGDGIASWWKQKVEPKFIKAWEVFDVRYFKNVQRLVELLQNHKDATLNVGPLANNPLDSIAQERRLYAMILGELYKDVVFYYNRPAGVAQIDSRYSTAVNVGNVKMKLDSNAEARRKEGTSCAFLLDKKKQAECIYYRDLEIANVPLLNLLKYNYNFDFANLTSSLKRGNHLPALASWTNGQNLKFQTELEYYFGKLESLMKTFRIESIESSEKTTIYTEFGPVESSESESKLTSSARNKEFLDAQKKVEESLNGIRALFENSGVTLNPFQKAIMEKCLYGLNSLTDEVATLGMMANSGSYARSEGASDDSTRFFGDCTEKILSQTKDVTGRRLGVDTCRQQAFKPN